MMLGRVEYLTAAKAASSSSQEKRTCTSGNTANHHERISTHKVSCPIRSTAVRNMSRKTSDPRFNGPWWNTASGLSSLTQEDRKRIREGFEHFNKNKLANGARFFSRFFKNNPAYLDLFPALHGVDPDEIAHHQFLLCVHVDRFFLIFEDFLQNMYNSEGLHSAVYGMLNSKSHIQINIEPIHCQNMLEALLETIVELLKEEKAWTPEMESSWKKFMAVLLEFIREEISDANKIKSPSPK